MHFIYTIQKYTILRKESLNIDGQQFHENQQTNNHLTP